MSANIKALLAILVASLLWSTNGFTNKILINAFDQFTVAFLRFSIASIIVLPFLLKQKKFFQPKKDVFTVALLSTLNIALFYNGLRTTTANAALILYSTSPLFVLLFARILVNETITKRRLLGILIGFIGVFSIIVLPKLGATHQITGDFVGNLWILGAVCSWALYTSGSKLLINKNRVSPLFLTGISFLVSAAVFFFLTLTQRHTINLAPLNNPLIVMLLLHLAVNVTVVAYFLFNWVIKQTTAATASLSGYLQPVFGIGLNMIILGEKATPLFLVGGLLALLGVYIASGIRLKGKGGD